MDKTAPVNIEFVCTGNNGRSRVAEAAAISYVQNAYPTLVSLIGISSSGMRVDENARVEITNFGRALFVFERLQKYRAGHNGLVNSNEMVLIENILSDKTKAEGEYGMPDGANGYRNKVNSLAGRIHTHFIENETVHRNQFLDNNGILLLQKDKTQFKLCEVADGSALYILGMEDWHTETARKTYSGKNNINIARLFNFAFEHPLEMEYSFGNPDYEMSKIFFDYVVKAARISVDKVTASEKKRLVP